jgi:hypothetical protein
MDKSDMPAHQITKCLFGFVPGKLAEQVAVWNVMHSTVICPTPTEGDNFFKQWVTGMASNAISQLYAPDLLRILCLIAAKQTDPGSRGRPPRLCSLCARCG